MIHDVASYMLVHHNLSKYTNDIDYHIDNR